MNIEQILFLALALGFSIFSMYMKSKKQKQSSKKDDSYHDFPQEPDGYATPEPVVVFEQFDVTNAPQNFNISTKKNKKTQKIQNTGVADFQTKTPENISQNAGSDNNIVLLEDFEGTEIQKAFLFSEIFKTVKR